MSYRPHFCDAISWTLRITIKPDTDGDGVPNEVELGWASDPTGLWSCLNSVNPDSDGDGFQDGDEIALGTNPCDEFSRPDVRADTDGDGLTDLDEVRVHFTDPSLYDTDRDGASDYAEIDLSARGYTFDPLLPSSHTPGSTVRDGNTTIYRSFDRDRDGAYDPHEEMLGLNPRTPDSDADNLIDGMELAARLNPLLPEPVDSSLGWPVIGTGGDTDLDGLSDELERRLGTDPNEFDTDLDGLGDGFEVFAGLDPLTPDSNGNGIADGDEDLDGDGLTNIGEHTHGASPLLSDSDSDGVDDNVEVLQGSFAAFGGDFGGRIEDKWLSTLTVTVPFCRLIPHPNSGAAGQGPFIDDWTVRVGHSVFRGNRFCTDPPWLRSCDTQHTIAVPRGTVVPVSAHFTGTRPIWANGLHRSVSITVHECAAESRGSVLWPPISTSAQSLFSACNYDALGNPIGLPYKRIYHPLSLKASGLNARTSYSGALYFPEISISMGGTQYGYAARSSVLSAQSTTTFFAGLSDCDADGVPDFADGFNLNPDDQRDDLSPGSSFTEFHVTVHAAPPNGLALIFPYLGHGAASIRSTESPNGDIVTDDNAQYGLRPVSRYRIWTKPPDLPRVARSVAEGGDQLACDEDPLELPLTGDAKFKFWAEFVAQQPRVTALVPFHVSIKDTITGTDLWETNVWEWDHGRSPVVREQSLEILQMASGNTAPTSVGALQYSNRPSPLVEIVARNARLGSDGEILVDIDWRMRDTLGELTQEPRYRVDGISFYAERKLVATVQGYSDLNSSPPNPPFRPRPHDHSGTLTLQIPPPVDVDEPNQRGRWQSGLVTIRAISTPNAVGRRGDDTLHIPLRWVAGVQSSALRTRLFPNGSIYSLVIDAPKEVDGSPEGVVEPIITRLSVPNNDIALPFTGAVGSQPFDFRPFAFSPFKQYFTNSTHRAGQSEPLTVLVVTADALPADMAGITSLNLGQDNRGVWRVYDKGTNNVRTEFTVAVVPSDLPSIISAPIGSDPQVDEEQLRTAYAFLTSQGPDRANFRARDLLRYFDETGGRIRIRDFWFADSNIVQENGNIVIEIDPDMDAFEAAEHLLSALIEALKLRTTAYSLRHQHAIGDLSDEASIQARIDEYVQMQLDFLATAKDGIELYKDGAFFFMDAAGDIVCVIEELSEGNYQSASLSAGLTFVPFVPASSARLVVRGSKNGPNLATIQGPTMAAMRALPGRTTLAAKVDLLRQSHSIDKVIDFIKSKPEIFGIHKTSDAARHAARKLMGPPPSGMRSHELHHDLPCNDEMRYWFAAHGLDVNEARFLRWVPATNHRMFHRSPAGEYVPGGEFNDQWARFIELERRRTTPYTQEQVLAFFEYMRATYP